MKKNILTILGIIVLIVISQAQNGAVAIRVGGGLIVDEPKMGFAGAFEFKIDKAPLVVSPYIQYFTSKD